MKRASLRACHAIDDEHLNNSEREGGVSHAKAKILDFERIDVTYKAGDAAGCDGQRQPDEPREWSTPTRCRPAAARGKFAQFGGLAERFVDGEGDYSGYPRNPAGDGETTASKLSEACLAGSRRRSNVAEGRLNRPRVEPGADADQIRTIRNDDGQRDGMEEFDGIGSFALLQTSSGKELMQIEKKATRGS